VNVEIGEVITWLGTRHIATGCPTGTNVSGVLSDIAGERDIPIRVRSMGANKRDMWKANYRKNKHLMSHGIKELFGKKRGRCAIIAGSGPSLQVEYLRKFRSDKWDIIACNDAYRLIGGDYAYFIDGADMDVMDKWVSDVRGKTKAVLSWFVRPKTALAGWSKTYWQGFWPKNLETDEQEVSQENLVALDKFGGTWMALNVTAVAFDFAFQCGYDTIVFVGCDFAYTNGQAHYGEPGTWNPVTTYKVAEQIGGGLTVTSEPLKLQSNMHEAMAWFARDAGRKVYNCTEGGIMCGDIECRKLEDVIREGKR
jgi:hypothetical protein